jgi:hypothetical protein
MKIKPYGHSEFIDFKQGKHLYIKDGQLIQNVTGITDVIDKPGLVYWSANQASEEIKETLVPGEALDEIQIEKLAKSAATRHTRHRDSAGSYGRLVHEAIEALIQKELLDKPLSVAHLLDVAENFEPVNELAKNAYQAWVRAMAEEFEGITFIESERIVWHQAENFIGTMDALAMRDGIFIFFDWKTSKSSYAEHGMQVSGYWGAAASVNPKITHKNSVRSIVHVPTVKQGYYKVYDEPRIRKELTGHTLREDYDAFLAAKRAYEWKQATPMEQRMKFVRRK